MILCRVRVQRTIKVPIEIYSTHFIYLFIFATIRVHIALRKCDQEQLFFFLEIRQQNSINKWSIDWGSSCFYSKSNSLRGKGVIELPLYWKHEEQSASKLVEWLVEMVA